MSTATVAPPSHKRKALSNTQRTQIATLHHAGLTPVAIAQQLDLKGGTVRMQLKRVRDGGHLERGYRGSPGCYPLTLEQKDAISETAAANNHFTLDQISTQVEQLTGRHINRHSISKALKAYGFTHKRLRGEAESKNSDETKEARIEWLDHWESELTAQTTIYFDESNLNASVAPGYGWAPKGVPAVKPTRVWKGKRVSIIGAFSPKDGLSYRVLEDTETVDAKDFTAFVRAICEQLHKARLRGTTYFILDNASIHKADDLSALLNRFSPDWHLLYLPKYSPRLNPIEQVWNALKAPVKHAPMNVGEDVRRAIEASYKHLKPESFARYFDHMQRIVYPLIRANSDLH